MTPEDEEEMTVQEELRRWELPGDHPESWIQINATYRDIWDRAISQERKECARIAESFRGTYPIWNAACNEIAAAIRARKP